VELGRRKKILLVSSGQPSLNPRLVKEADTLSEAGFDVTVLYAYWNEWGTKSDETLLAEKKWKAIRVAGDPQHKTTIWFLSRLIHRTSVLLLQKTNKFNYFADYAIARASYYLIKAAGQYPADLYIGHNLGALPAVAKTAAKYGKPYGFDLEDFHRQEASDDTNSYHYRICKYIEDKYLPQAKYLTASSPPISDQYAALYDCDVVTLINVFPKTRLRAPVRQVEIKPLKLFWVSQTVGNNRGIERIIEAINISKTGAVLHLLGNITDDYKQQLLTLAQNNGLDKNDLVFYEPVNPDEIPSIATAFDVGMATETGFCLNNNLALSNKIFSYIQSGLALAMSNTPGQSGFLEQFPQIGKVYNTAEELAAIIQNYHQHRELLYQTKTAAFTLGQTGINWENESEKLLAVVNQLLDKA
jgi:hypothetical protein